MGEDGCELLGDRVVGEVLLLLSAAVLLAVAFFCLRFSSAFIRSSSCEHSVRHDEVVEVVEHGWQTR